MTLNWYLTKLIHEERVKEIQRNAQLRQLARANRQPDNWLNTVLSRLRRSLGTLRPRQRRQANLPKRARGATV